MLNMKIHNELEDHIVHAWRQLKEAANKEDWGATQQVFREMVKLQDINEQSRTLQQRIADLSNGTLTPKPAAWNNHRAAQVNQFNRRRRETVRPKELRIGTDRILINISNQIPIATANWILKHGKALPRIENFVHPTDSGFARSAQIKPLDDGSYIEIGDNQEVLIQKARRLLNECGFGNVQLVVLLADGSQKTG
jgi:hypothetical protein